ncbi:hypothetical protein K435DRAFT_427282 [Dendrothele bispora CBS 962.96]|uniref:Uncharacterized protein n=1 Tax=Dendrothele bispora (strain CBS 962.96) TaxID=1314807 RepID=A0A4S8MFP2_DENBC|nr:hypothetical protein K435DRAFT_427282 [Dendrothele bispora CBS 962.96]
MWMDNLRLKLLVVGITVLSTTQIILVCMLDYRFLVTSYADPFVLTTGSWTIYVSSLFDYLIVITVQMFFAKMIFQLLKGFRKWLLVVGLMMFIVSEFAFGICWIVKE